MAFSLSGWRARHLLVAWTVYWIALILVGARNAIAAASRALNAPKGLGSISASVDNGNFILKVTSQAEVWSGSMSLSTMALWFAGPPLLLFLLWLVTRRSPVEAQEHEREREYRPY